jgi:hypothetical protein
VDAVDLGDGTRLPVDHRYLASLLGSDPPETAQALAVLDRAFAFHNSRSDPSFSPADLEALSTILAGPEYLWPAEAGPNPLAEIWQRFLNWTARLIARLFSGAALGPVANTVLIAGIALLLGLVLRFAYVHSIRTMIREAEAVSGTQIPSGLTADAAFDRARSLSESGDLREAVRFLYLAALLALDERGRIRLDRAHTNRELLSDLSPWSELAARFKTVVEIFDRVWYGFQPISREEFGRYAEEVAALRKNDSYAH